MTTEDKLPYGMENDKLPLGVQIKINLRRIIGSKLDDALEKELENKNNKSSDLTSLRYASDQSVIFGG